MRRKLLQWAAAMLLVVSVALSAGGDGALTVTGGRQPSLEVDRQGGLHVAYEGLGKTNDIYCRNSTDQGQSWSEEANISSTPGVSRHPAMVAEPDGALDVVWEDTSAGPPDVYTSRSTDGGRSWSPAINLSKTPGSSRQPAVALGPHNGLYAVWVDDSEGSASPDIFYAFSLNGGKSWSKPVNVSHTPGVSSMPAIAIGRDGVIHVAWLDTTSGDNRPDVFYTRSYDDHWSQPINVSNTPGASTHPDIAVGPNGQVYLVWSDASRNGKNTDIYFSRSEGEGKFTPPIFFNTPGDSSDPCIAVDDQDHVAVAWADTTSNPKTPDIFLVQSGDQGRTFTPPNNISNTPGVSRAPDVVIFGGKVIAVWEEAEKGSTWLKLTSAEFPRRSRRPVGGGKY